MDPFTQGLTGIIAAQSPADKETIRHATVAGLIGGMLPDADIFIHTANDPLFNLLIHRHFTHALIFIPVGALIAAIMAWLLLRRRLGFLKTYFFATLGYATGGLLDACTTYGTYLYWPFSDHRVAWDNIAIIDPAYSLILLAAIILSFRNKARRYARIGLSLALCYLMIGVAARNEAARVLRDSADHRGHQTEGIRVMPTIGNLILWRGIYEVDGRFHVDGIRLGLLGPHRVFGGPVVQKFQADECASGLGKTRVCQNIDGFSHFADGYVFAYTKEPLVIADLRYSILPHEIEPLWGLVVHPKNPEKRSQLRYFDQIDPETLKQFWRMLAGAYP